MAKTSAEMVAEAKARVEAISPEEAAGRDDVLFLDVRDPSEVAASGKVKGAVNVPRGMLEFKADPSSASHEAALSEALKSGKTIVTYCAMGGRAAMAAAALKDLGYENVRHMGGFKDWESKGLPVEKG